MVDGDGQSETNTKASFDETSWYPMMDKGMDESRWSIDQS